MICEYHERVLTNIFVENRIWHCKHKSFHMLQNQVTYNCETFLPQIFHAYGILSWYKLHHHEVL